MKKRLRKKLRLREFQPDSLDVCLTLNLAEDDAKRRLFWQKLVEAIHTQGLFVLGRADEFNVFTNYNATPRPPMKQANRLWLMDWLQQQPEVSEYWVSAPSNGDWYPPALGLYATPKLG